MSKQAGEVSAAVIQMVEERAKDPKWVWGSSWGADFPALDHLTHGIHEKKMILLISRPGIGKSAFAAKVTLAQARKFKAEGKGMRARVVTLEMDAESWQLRMGCLIANVSAARIESGYATPAQQARFIAAQTELARLPIDFMEEAESIEEIKRFVAADGKCGFWVLDHIGIVPGIAGAFSTYQALQKSSIMVTQICHRKVTGLIIGHQRRVNGKDQDDKRPTLDDVAGADQIAKDADVAIGLYRLDQNTKEVVDQNRPIKPAEIIVMKNRKGGMGKVHAFYNTSRTDWKEDEYANQSIFQLEKEEADGNKPTP